MSRLKNKLNKTADATNEIEKLVEKFTDSLKGVVIKELEANGIETSDYDRNDFNAGAIAVGLAALGTYNDSAGYVNYSFAEKIQEAINKMISESEKGEDNNE